jgi:hypothetical protein
MKKKLCFVLLLFAIGGCSTGYWQQQAEIRERGQLNWEHVQADPSATGWDRFVAFLGKPMNTPPESCKEDAKRPECVNSALAGGAINGAGAAGAGVGSAFAFGDL